MKASQAFILSSFVLCLVPAVARAVPQPNGADFKVSSCDLCKKRVPAVAGAAKGATAGSFTAAWESTSTSDPLGISARFFAKTGAPRAADLRVNADTIPAQYSPAVAADAQGNYVVVWAVVNGVNSDIKAQRYKASGLANGPAILVSTDAPGQPAPLDITPAVATTADGGFAVAWTASVPPTAGSPGATPAVMVRRFNSAGVPLGPQVKISSGLVQGRQPGLCIDTAGRAVVAWTSVDAFRPFEPNLQGVVLRRVLPTGVPLGAELVVAPPTSSESTAVVLCGAGNTFVVVWSTDQAPAAQGLDIVGQRFTALGRRNGPVFRINGTTAGDQTEPAVASDAAGNFVVVWQSHASVPAVDTVSGRRFLASATADGSDFVVHTRVQLEDRPADPAVANLGAAGFVVVWTQGSRSVQGRRYKLTP